MRPNKAPPDVLPPFFFQKNWNVVGESLVKFVGQAFEKGSFPVIMNKTLISLILNQVTPERMGHLRPSW